MEQPIVVENTEVTGWGAAFRGMRNPKNSWDRSDSDFSGQTGPVIGPNDLKLAKALVSGGPVHRKFLRMIHVSCDITAPAYWIPEFDTYKVATTRNSCSFMHKGASRELVMGDFHFDRPEGVPEWITELQGKTLEALNFLRERYNETKDMGYFRLLRQMLPHGYMIRFTWDSNYETLLGIYKWRHDHRLVEWRAFCEWIKGLPYMGEFLSAAGLATGGSGQDRESSQSRPS